jgi:hypothetical protein
VTIRQLQTAAEETVKEVRAAANVAAHTAAILHELGDEEGSRSVDRLARSLPRTPATIVVAGEFKAGKTTLVNAILGARVVPADPLDTTPVPVRILHGTEPAIVGRARLGAAADDASGEGPAIGAVEEVLDRDRFVDLMARLDPRLGQASLDHVEVRLDHPLLALGIRLVDTPSISGGITSPMAGVVLGEVAAADAMVFVTDASQELTAPEIEFLQVASSLDTAVVVAMSKVDLSPSWRQVLDRNHDHLAAAFGEAPPIFPVAATLRQFAVRYGDASLDTESGLPLLAWYLVANIGSQVRQRAIVAAGEVLQHRLAEVEDSVSAARRALGSAQERRLVQAQLDASLERAARLDRQWQPRLRVELDQFQLDVEGDLGERVQFVGRLVAQSIDTHDPDQDWAVIDSTFNEAVNRATVGHAQFIKERAAAVYAAMEEFLGVPDGALAAERPIELDERPIAVELDRPDLVVDSSSQMVLAGSSVSRYAWLAGSAAGAAFAWSGPGAVVIGAVAGLGAAGAGALFWRKRGRTSALEESRRRARAQAQLDVAEASRAAGLASRAARSQLNARIQDDILANIGQLKAQLHQDIARFQLIAEVSEESRPAKDLELEELLHRIRTVRAHAARLEHRVESPLLEVPVR